MSVHNEEYANLFGGGANRLREQMENAVRAQREAIESAKREQAEAARQKAEYEKLQAEAEAKAKAEAEEKKKKLEEEAKASAEQKRLEAEIKTTGTGTDKVGDDKKAKNKKLLMWGGVAVAGLIFLVILVKKVSGSKAVASSAPSPTV